MARSLLLAAAGAAALAALTFVSSVAFADVTMESRISMQGSGAMSIANMSGTTKTAISGTRSRTDRDIQLQIMGAVAFALCAVLGLLFWGIAASPTSKVLALSGARPARMTPSS